jgi:hypothetical protein
VFVHGMLLSSAMWQYQMLHLAENGFRAVAYDRRGPAPPVRLFLIFVRGEQNLLKEIRF